MKTGNDKSTNNFIIRLWSPKYYKSDNNIDKIIIDGTITNVLSKEVKFFHSEEELLKQLIYMQDKAERYRK